MADDCFLVSNSSLSKCHSPFTHNWALFCPFTAVGQVTADELRYILGIHSPSVLGFSWRQGTSGLVTLGLRGWKLFASPKLPAVPTSRACQKALL